MKKSNTAIKPIKPTIPIQYFIVGDAELMKAISRGDYEFICELTDHTGINSSQKIVRIDHLKEVTDKKTALRIYKAARDLGQNVEIWRRKGNSTPVRQISSEEIQKMERKMRNGGKKSNKNKISTSQDKTKAKKKLLQEDGIMTGTTFAGSKKEKHPFE